MSMIYSPDIFGDSWDISCHLPACLSPSDGVRGAGEKASWHHRLGKWRALLCCLPRARLPSISRLQCRQREQQPYLSVTPSKHHPHQPQPDSQQLEQAHKSLFEAVFQREWIWQMRRKVDLGNVVVFPRFNLNRPSPGEW